MEFKDAFNYGVPTVLLLFILGGLWKIIAWGKSSVVEPLLKSHLELIQTLQKSIPETNIKLGEIITTAKVASEKQEKSMIEVAETAREVATIQQKQLEGVQQSLDNQTILIRNSIEKQTKVIQEKP